MNQAVSGARSFVVALSLCLPSLTFASPHYLFFNLGGDEIAPTDLNDRGVVVMSGNYNVVPGGGAWLGSGGDWTSGTRVQGFGYGDNPYGGVEVGDINNAGDLLGRAIRNGAWVPTQWLDGTPFDLTEPDNAGMTFDYDAGPKWTQIDPWLLDVPGLPFDPLPDDRIHDVRALTNLRGDYVVAFNYLGYGNAWGGMDISYALLTRVPEPSSPLLVGAAIGALLLAGMRGRKRSIDLGRTRR